MLTPQWYIDEMYKWYNIDDYAWYINVYQYPNEERLRKMYNSLSDCISYIDGYSDKNIKVELSKLHQYILLKAKENGYEIKNIRYTCKTYIVYYLICG